MKSLFLFSIIGLILSISLAVANRFRDIPKEKTITIVLEHYVVFQKNSYLLKFKNLTDGNDMYLIVNNCCPCNFKNKINKEIKFKEDYVNLPNQIDNLKKLVCQ